MNQVSYQSQDTSGLVQQASQVSANKHVSCKWCMEDVSRESWITSGVSKELSTYKSLIMSAVSQEQRHFSIMSHVIVRQMSDQLWVTSSWMLVINRRENLRLNAS